MSLGLPVSRRQEPEAGGRSDAASSERRGSLLLRVLTRLYSNGYHVSLKRSQFTVCSERRQDTRNIYLTLGGRVVGSDFTSSV